jgi:copper chaperone
MCGCSTHTAAETETTTAAGAATFIVPDMTCGHCEKTVRGAFDKAMPGAAVDIDLSQHKVTVDGDAARVRAVLVAAGYPPNAA